MKSSRFAGLLGIPARDAPEPVACDQPTKRERAACGAHARSTGSPCRNRVTNPANGRCKHHGGWGSGPKTDAGRQRISDAQKRRHADARALAAADRKARRAARIARRNAKLAKVEKELARLERDPEYVREQLLVKERAEQFQARVGWQDLTWLLPGPSTNFSDSLHALSRGTKGTKA